MSRCRASERTHQQPPYVHRTAVLCDSRGSPLKDARLQSPLHKSPMLRSSPDQRISLKEIRDSPFLNAQVREMVCTHIPPVDGRGVLPCKRACSSALKGMRPATQEKSGKITTQARSKKDRKKKKKKLPPKVSISSNDAQTVPRAASLPALGADTPVVESPWMAKMRAASAASPGRAVRPLSHV